MQASLYILLHYFIYPYMGTMLLPLILYFSVWTVFFRKAWLRNQTFEMTLALNP